MTPLDKTLKRLVRIQGDDFVVTLTPDALKVTRKGHQRGVEMRWESLVSGDSALALALQASVGQFEKPRIAAQPAARPRRRSRGSASTVGTSRQAKAASSKLKSTGKSRINTVAGKRRPPTNNRQH